MLSFLNYYAIESVALISFLVCLVFTYQASKDNAAVHGQTVRESMIEAWENIFWGFLINWSANLVLLPVMIKSIDSISGWDAFLLGWPYTVISLLRQFIIRRKNNKKEVNREIEREKQGTNTTTT